MRTLPLVALAAAVAVRRDRRHPRVVAAHVRYSTTLTWVGQIAPIVEKRCVACHTDRGIAEPFDTYVQVRPWLRAVREELLEGRMPRWPAVRAVGEHANGPRMSKLERDLIVAWIDGGAPAATPPGFGLRVIDEEVAAADAARIALRSAGGSVGPEGDATWNLVVPVNVPPGADEWIGAIANADGITRAIAAWTVIDPTAASEVSVEAAGVDLGTWVPGSGTLEAPEGTAWRIQVPGRLRVRVVSGSPDRRRDAAGDTRLRLVFRFAPDPPATIESLAVRVGDAPIEQPCAVVSVRPVSNVAGASLEVVARGPGGSRDLLAWIPSNLADMRPTYLMRRPVPLAAGSVIELRSSDPGARASLGLVRNR